MASAGGKSNFENILIRIPNRLVVNGFINNSEEHKLLFPRIIAMANTWVKNWGTSGNGKKLALITAANKRLPAHCDHNSAILFHFQEVYIEFYR